MMKTSLRLLAASVLATQAILWAGCKALPKDPEFALAHPRMRSLPIPPKMEWKAKASAIESEFYQASYACDGKMDSRWSSPSEDPHWIAFDLGTKGTICGFVIHWEAAYSSSYRIEISRNGKRWKTVYETENGDGQVDDINISPVVARHVRMYATKRGSGWGHSFWEIDIKGPAESTIIEADGEQTTVVADGSLDTVWQSKGNETASVKLNLRKEIEFGGLRIDWGTNHAQALDFYASIDGTNWNKLADLREGSGRYDLLLHPKHRAQYLRLDLSHPADTTRPFEIRDLVVRGPNEMLTTVAMYELAAKKAKPGYYPDSMRGQQVYWTLSGLPQDTEESLLDEYGNLEPRVGSSSLMPYIHMDGTLYSAFDAENVKQSLAEDVLPMPSVEYRVNDLDVRVDVFTEGTTTDSVTFARYMVSNASADQRKTGKLFLAIRPVQVNPPWQYGGLSPIRSIERIDADVGATVRVNGRDDYVSLTPPDGFGAARFDRGDIVRYLDDGELPDESRIEGEDELLSGALMYTFDLHPGEIHAVTVAAPLHESTGRMGDFSNDAATVDDVFHARRDAVVAFWKEQLGAFVIDLPDKDVVNTLLSQIPYILINRDGEAIQPGSRNYNRVWIRDGGLTSAALMRVGLFEQARSFLEWYSDRVEEDGLVPPILTTDGAVYTGFGSNLEYDSQGQFVYAIMEYYRFTQDKVFLEKHFDRMIRALQFQQRLRDQTLTKYYMSEEEARERFVGILPKSISHEGYNPPRHSYWDDYFALKGLKDGIDAAKLMGRDDLAAWALEEYVIMSKALKKSIEATIRHKKIDYIPGAAELGDFDATSTAIAFFPCQVDDVLPTNALAASFDRYYADLEKRFEPGWSGRFTPYEVRSVLAFVALEQKDRALALLEYLNDSRRPPGWNHLAEVVISELRIGSYIGDMPHTWVGSGYVNSVRGMLVQEIDGVLVLLPGTPASWVNEGEGITLQHVPTHFGVLNLQAIAENGVLTVEIDAQLDPPGGVRMVWPMEGKPSSVTVDGASWSDFDERSCRLPVGVKRVVARWN